MNEYGWLDEIAQEIADRACKEMNRRAYLAYTPNIPYKAQYVLEEVIKILEERR